MRFTAVQRISLTSGDWLFGIRVENTVRITCVFKANLKRTNRKAVVYTR